jgi:hypothetical protein
MIHGLLKLDKGHPADRALRENNYLTGISIAGLTDFEIELLEFTDFDNNGDKFTKDLHDKHKILIKLATGFLKLKNRDSEGNLTNDEIENITKKEWDNFRLNIPCSVITDNMSGKVPSSLAAQKNKDLNNVRLQNFIKGIKRDKTQYNILKDEKYFHSWVQMFIPLADSHQISDVFNN